MGKRITPLITGEMYHVYNRSIARQPIFPSIRSYQRLVDILDFYRFHEPPVRYSHFVRLTAETKTLLLDELYKKNQKLVEIYAYVLMPNHFHFLLKQIREEGIKTFMSKIQNSYAKYFNTKYERTGGLFQEMFKAVHIETDEQLIHVTRYIHLNPLTGYIVKDFDGLKKYTWSSANIYLANNSTSFVNTELILNFFSSRAEFAQFTFDQINYQRELDKIKHLSLE